MLALGTGATRCAALLLSLLALARCSQPSAPFDMARSHVERVLQAAMSPSRPGQIGLATVWDSNAYIQCRNTAARGMRCEAAGSLMQPSLRHILTPVRIDRLDALGWKLDPSFGNYVQTFDPALSTDRLAGLLLTSLVEGYGAAVPDLEFQNSWVADKACPPRNGPSQNLAGLISSAPAMAPTAVHACSYTPKPEPETPVPSLQEITHPTIPDDPVSLYSAGVQREIGRLLAHIGGSRVFMVLDTGAGYVQCEPEEDTPPALYCEAQSAESWPALADRLTADRIAHLHAAGFADPGLRQNYFRDYPAVTFDDATIAAALLTILHDVYGYDGSPSLTVRTESGDHALP
jgi:hypothetical protein